MWQMLKNYFKALLSCKIPLLYAVYERYDVEHKFCCVLKLWKGPQISHSTKHPSTLPLFHTFYFDRVLVKRHDCAFVFVFPSCVDLLHLLYINAFYSYCFWDFVVLRPHVLKPAVCTLSCKCRSYLSSMMLGCILHIVYYISFILKWTTMATPLL